MDQSACLEPDQIRRYVLGTVDEQQIEQIASHLRACPPCQAVADELDSASDDLLEALRSSPPESPYVSEPQCQSASDRLTTLHHKHPWVFQPRGLDDPSEGELELPQVLGDYVLLERIGGHLGAVYKAFHAKLERLVAVKMLPTGLLANDAAVGWFQREIKAIGRLDHPNIVRAHDARQVGGKLLLVMEYVDGCDLAELVRRRGPLPIAEACELTRQAAVGLQYVCQHGLVHRDIKPANLMLSRDGQVKLLDLGLAHFRILQPTGDEASSPGLTIGTADYMAPEQAGNSENVDIRADIYSLGCTLYKLLAGRAPFETPDCESILDKRSAHLKRPAPPIKQLRRDVPDALAALVDRMLAKNPAERFETPDQVAAALTPFAAGSNLQTLVAGRRDGEPADTSGQNVHKRPSPRSTRWFWELVAVAALVLVLLLVFGGKPGIDHVRSLWNRVAPGVFARLGSAPADGQPSQSRPDGQTPSRHPTTPAESQPSQSLSTDRPGQTGAGSTAKPAGFTVQLNLDRPSGVYLGPPAGPSGKGESIQVTIAAEQSGYLYLLDHQADGTLVCLFPNMYQTDNKLEAGRPVAVPDPGGDFELRADPPYGTETLVALVSLKPIEPTRFGVASLTERQFTLVDHRAVERLRAELKQSPGTWAETRVPLTTRPGDLRKSQPSEPRAPPPSPRPESAAPGQGQPPGTDSGGAAPSGPAHRWPASTRVAEVAGLWPNRSDFVEDHTGNRFEMKENMRVLY